ncbi:MAG: hypothetical protein ABFS32_06080 [Bacteroidota bacterium]
MKWLLIFLVLIALLQVVLFFYTRKIKKELKNNVIEKYNLHTPKDAWEALANPDISEADKIEIRKLYEAKE